MPLGIYEKSEEHKAKLTAVLAPYRFVKGIAPWNKGTKGVMHSWNKGKTYKCKISAVKTLEWRQKISEGLKGHIPWNKGVRIKNGKATLTEQLRRSDRYKKWRADVFRRDGWTCQTCGLRGHGKDIESHHIIPMKTILQQVAIVGISEEEKYQLAMLLPEIFDVNNGVTLCKSCHVLTYSKCLTSEP